MKYSQLFGKPVKEDQSGSDMRSHQLLQQAGFIAESVAGRYFFLPLGWRVHDKIKAVIKKRMDAVGGQEMITPTLHPLELWEETNRTSTTGFELMKVEDRRGGKFALGGTAEEMMVDVVRKRQISYKELPFNIYQFSTKFRDEARARGGLLRVREFVMKDAYTFDRNEAAFEKTYHQMAEVYSQIFTDLGLETKKVEADGGYIGGDYCHEYQVESAVGEGVFYETEDGSYCAHEDVVIFERNLINPDEPLQPIEVIDQPDWVKTMEDNEKHYGLPANRFLKNVVYHVTTSTEIIIVTIRGDLEVNKTKLERALNLTGQLESATEEDLAKLGTKSGFVHAWGHKARYIGDLSLLTVKNFIGGQKTETTDTINVNYGRDFECEMLADVAKAFNGAKTADGKTLVEKVGVEVGNIFQLGTHYTAKMKDATYIDETGQSMPYYMGCYGIGLGRTMATIAEVLSDEKGLIWPEVIAPFKVYLAPIGKDQAVYDKADELYQQFLTQGIEVLYDDRQDKKSTPGQKFGNHELLGIPYRVVLSERLLENDEAEIVHRGSGKITIIKLNQVINFFSSSSEELQKAQNEIKNLKEITFDLALENLLD